VIGAVAYRVWMRDQYRTTEDVDAAVALDLEELSKLTRELGTATGRYRRMIRFIQT
jgi:hypothetical protein